MMTRGVSHMYRERERAREREREKEWWDLEEDDYEVCVTYI